MIEINEEIFDEFMSTIEGKDYAGGQLPRVARYAFELYCHQKRCEFVGPMPMTLIDLT